MAYILIPLDHDSKPKICITCDKPKNFLVAIKVASGLKYVCIDCYMQNPERAW